jgi:hypothetical protein
MDAFYRTARETKQYSARQKQMKITPLQACDQIRKVGDSG